MVPRNSSQPNYLEHPIHIVCAWYARPKHGRAAAVGYYLKRQPRKGCTEAGAGTLDHARLPTKLALQQQQCCRACGSMHASHNV